MNTIHIYDQRPYIKGQVEITPNMVSLFKEMSKYAVIILDGPPGIGKTTLYGGFMKYLQMKQVPFELVTSDDDVLERKKRGTKEIIEYHQGNNLGEVLNTFLPNRIYSPGRNIQIPLMKYNGKTGCIDTPHMYNVPKYGEGILLIEGVRSVKITAKCNNFEKKFSQMLFLMIHKSREIVNKQRYQRDRYQKGLSKEVIFNRIETQEKALQAYYTDLAGDLRESTALYQNKTSKIIFR